MNDWIKKNLLGTLSLAAIIAAVIWGKDILNLVFPDEQTKWDTIRHVKESKTEREYYEKLDVLDTVADFAKRDAEENLKRDQERDSLVKRNAVTIYQIKEQQKSTDSLLRVYIKIHDQ